MQTLANIFAVVMLVITVSSAIAAITDTPKSDGWWRKIYYVIDFCALNVGKAKQKQGIWNMDETALQRRNST